MRDSFFTKTRCDRCGAPLTVRIMSMFNDYAVYNIIVVHALNPAAIQRLSAPIAVLNFKKSVFHTHCSFPIITCISIQSGSL